MCLSEIFWMQLSPEDERNETQLFRTGGRGGFDSHRNKTGVLVVGVKKLLRYLLGCSFSEGFNSIFQGIGRKINMTGNKLPYCLRWGWKKHSRYPHNQDLGMS